MSYNRTTTYVPKQTNHLLHLIISACTCGMWLPVWAAVAVWNAFAKDKHVSTQAWYGQPVARPYEVGPGAAVSATNPHPPTPGVPTPPMPRTFGVGPEPVGVRWELNPGGMPVCQHGVMMNAKCEGCARPARWPQ